MKRPDLARPRTALVVVALGRERLGDDGRARPIVSTGGRTAYVGTPAVGVKVIVFCAAASAVAETATSAIVSKRVMGPPSVRG